MSNWSNKILTKEQLFYAAEDAAFIWKSVKNLKLLYDQNPSFNPAEKQKNLLKFTECFEKNMHKQISEFFLNFLKFDQITPTIKNIAIDENQQKSLQFVHLKIFENYIIEDHKQYFELLKAQKTIMLTGDTKTTFARSPALNANTNPANPNLPINENQNTKFSKNDLLKLLYTLLTSSHKKQTMFEKLIRAGIPIRAALKKVSKNVGVALKQLSTHKKQCKDELEAHIPAAGFHYLIISIAIPFSQKLSIEEYKQFCSEIDWNSSFLKTFPFKLQVSAKGSIKSLVFQIF